MGKIRVKTLGIEDEEKKQAEDAKRRAEEKRIEALRAASAEKAAGKAGEANEVSKEETATELAKDQSSSERKKYKAKTAKKIKGKKYVAVASKVEKSKIYKLAEALKLLPELKVAKFDETVELHINTTETGVSGSVTLPHGTGKQTRVAIATDEIIAEIEKGQINFDVLVAEPQMMPKLAKVAKVLGPRGLMPNPKNGTVTPHPEEVAKKYAGGQMNFKTEGKFPLLHLVVGKLSFSEDKLSENIKVMLKQIPNAKIKNVTLKSTMSPAIKLDHSSV